MKPAHLVPMLALIVVSCERKPTAASLPQELSSPQAEIPQLTISPMALSSLKDRNAQVIFEGVLDPNDSKEFLDVSGSGSIGYYVDEQFSLDQADGFVRLYGTDGSESGAAYGGELSRNDGSITASYRMINEGIEPRHVLVYTTKAEQDADDQLPARSESK